LSNRVRVVHPDQKRMEHAAIVESHERDPDISHGPRVKPCSRKASIVNRSRLVRAPCPISYSCSARQTARGVGKEAAFQEDSPHEIGEALAQFVNRSSALQYLRR
jgi:hypothetical protein